MLRKLIVGTVAAGIALSGAATAAAAPSSGTVQICVDGGADYGAFLYWPNRGGMASAITDPGKCIGGLPQNARELVEVQGIRRGGLMFDMGHFTGNGTGQAVHVHGTAAAPSFTVSN